MAKKCSHGAAAESFLLSVCEDTGLLHRENHAIRGLIGRDEKRYRRLGNRIDEVTIKLSRSNPTKACIVWMRWGWVMYNTWLEGVEKRLRESSSGT